MAAVDTAEPGRGKKKKGGRRQKKRIGIRIDMTPMVDVAFLLLIFFMVTTVFLAPQTMEINLPPSEQKVDIAESNLMILYITEGNSVFWGIGREKPQRVVMKDLQSLLAEKNKANPKLITLVKLDRKARYHMMVDMLDELNVGNVIRFSIAPLTDRDKEVLSKA
jgi:biopolymer transport protein ExbD